MKELGQEALEDDIATALERRERGQDLIAEGNRLLAETVERAQTSKVMTITAIADKAGLSREYLYGLLREFKATR